jgi:hypothetical protein
MARIEGVTAPRFAMFSSMPLLTELVSINDGYGYRPGAPNGAVATRQHCISTELDWLLGFSLRDQGLDGAPAMAVGPFPASRRPLRTRLDA